MTQAQLVLACKLACRVSSDSTDSEFNDLINAGFGDLEISGIADTQGNPYTAETADQLVIIAIKTYVKLHYGDLLSMDEYDKLNASYWEQKAQLKMRTYSDSRYQDQEES